MFSVVEICICCNKLVWIPELINTITALQTFSTDANATAAVMAIYSDMSLSNGGVFSNGGTTLYAGLSADELNDVAGLTDQFLSNTLLSSNTTPYSAFWKPAYYDIYMANAVVTGLQGFYHGNCNN